MEIGFAASLLVFGGLLWIAAALSGVMRGTALSISVLAVACGVLLAELGVVSVDPQSAALRHIVELALVITLFSDGLVVERELLREHWSSPARSLIVALPITLVLLGLMAKLLFPGLTWAEAFLLGAVLSPTDPVVSSALLPDTGAARRGLRDRSPQVRGRNAGRRRDRSRGRVARGEDPSAAAVRGSDRGVHGHLRPRRGAGRLRRRRTDDWQLTIGNGLLAAFMAGLLLGTLQEETPEPFAVFSDYTSAVAQVVTFFAFGALIVASGFDASGWALVGMILFAFLVARPLAVLLASARGDLELKQRAFIAWFGPKGVASMLFALIVLDSKAPHAGLVFQVAAFVVLASICSHGLTDTIAARWISEPVSEEQVAAEERGEDALEGAPRG